MHCRICGNCCTCTSGAYANFCTRNLDFGNSTRSGLFVGCKIFLPLAELISNFSLLLLSAAFMIYIAATVSTVVALMLHFGPRYGQTNLLVYLVICSLMGALTVIMFCSSLLPSSPFILWWNLYNYILVGHDTVLHM